MSDENFAPQITELISDPDNAEKLRDLIAFIIKKETQIQYALAVEEKIPDSKIFNTQVFIENARPYDTEGEAIPSPLVNIMLQKVVAMDGNSRVGPQKEKATFVIDCVTFGNDSGVEWDDKAAAVRAWKIARVIRRILMSEQYAYLGLRGLVGSRLVTSIETGVPENGGEALTVVSARITFEVQFVERAIQTTGPIIEAIDFTLDPSSGEVLINAD